MMANNNNNNNNNSNNDKNDKSEEINDQMKTSNDDDDDDLTQIKNLIFEKLSSNDTNAFRQLIMQLKDGVNFVDETGMTPLQHACCKANREAVEMLLNMVYYSEKLYYKETIILLNAWLECDE